MVRGSLYCYAPAGARKQTSNTNGDAVKKKHNGHAYTAGLLYHMLRLCFRFPSFLGNPNAMNYTRNAALPYIRRSRRTLRGIAAHDAAMP